ncbi:MAG: 1-acyl-sn-glycerol-3-phosphate acyltransferase [Verrucomicrobiales bacterium]|nr:1-acyl-sn-glycerol-3-phosphate acyltransferase [Verrucomicrobiales bacterium]
MMWPASEKLMEDYKTSEKSASWLAKLFPSLVYYPRAFFVVLNAARMAEKGLYDRAAWASSSRGITRALEGSGVQMTIKNVAVLKKLDSPCVFVGNHMSTLETFVLPAIIQPHLDVTFVIKQSLIEYPVFKHVMQSCDPVVVNYSSPREDLKTMLTGGVERLQKGVSMVVFPQGKRTTGFDQEKFNSIAVKIAKRAGVPVVPVALRTDAWGSDGWKVRDFGKIRPQCPVHFEFGEPMQIEGNGRDNQAELAEFIGSRYRKWTEDSPIPQQW